MKIIQIERFIFLMLSFVMFVWIHLETPGYAKPLLFGDGEALGGLLSSGTYEENRLIIEKTLRDGFLQRTDTRNREYIGVLLDRLLEHPILFDRHFMGGFVSFHPDVKKALDVRLGEKLAGSPYLVIASNTYLMILKKMRMSHYRIHAKTIIDLIGSYSYGRLDSSDVVHLAEIFDFESLQEYHLRLSLMNKVKDSSTPEGAAMARVWGYFLISKIDLQNAQRIKGDLENWMRAPSVGSSREMAPHLEWLLRALDERIQSIQGTNRCEAILQPFDGV